MKLLCSLFVLVSLGIFVPNLHADPVVTLTTTAGAALNLTVTDVGGAEIFNYTNVGVGGLVPLGADVVDFTAILAYSPLVGAEVLSVTDLCANVTLLGSASSCGLGFTFTDASLGTPVLDAATSLLGVFDVTVNADALGIAAGASVGGGDANFTFENPPPTSVAPEPNALTLFGTGLLGVAGVMKKKFCA